METHPTPVLTTQSPPLFQKPPETLLKDPLPSLFPVTGISISGPGEMGHTERQGDKGAKELPELAKGHSGSGEAERGTGYTHTGTVPADTD